MYFIDVQGTLISDEDKSPIEGSREFISMLNAASIPYMVVTNNTKKSPQNFHAFLNSLGFEFGFEKYLDPLMLLESVVPKEGVAAYGDGSFIKTLESMGFLLDYERPKSLLVGIKEDFCADEYAQMIEFLLQGASLVGMHETSIYATKSKRYPGVGAILKMLEFATSTPYTVVGKPSTPFYNAALKALQKQDANAAFDSIIMISDDVKGDLGGAKELGMQTYFVTSGKYKTQEEIVPFLEQHLRPDRVFANMKEILESR